MEIEEPIQQLLKNTGWSCEDLLAKLQQYKTVKESSKQEKQLEKAAKETEEKNTLVAEECMIESTEEINESDITKVQNLEASINVVNRKCETINSSRPITEDFSDTDEEEVEVNATNSNIINEIIDDISSADNSEGPNKSNLSYQPTSDKDDTTEVTEVRVIEVNSDNEDDDDFEDGCPYKISNVTKKIEYLETYPRKALNKLSQSDHNNAENINVTINEDKNGKSNSNSQQVCLESPFTFPNKLCINSHQTESNPKASCSSKNDSSEKNMSQTFSNFRAVEPENVENDVNKFTPENVEDIRNNLKLQLSCLRTRKKPSLLQDLKSKVTDITKQSVFTSKVSSNNNSITPDNSLVLNSGKKNEAEDISKIENRIADDSGENSLYTQTNEFGLVILNVQGGIDIDNLETSGSNTTAPGNNFNENSSNANDSILETTTRAFSNSNTMPTGDNLYLGKEDIDPKGVFDEIRKIIRKQRDPTNKNRKYGFSETRSEETMDSSDFINSLLSQRVEDRNNSFESATFSAENSLSSFIADDNDQITDKNSPFVSNTLDEFLTENSKLNISYKVPKSGAEDGLTDSYHEESHLILKKVVKIDGPTKPKPTKVETIKAKTVAQKRKLLEKQRLKEVRMANQEKNKVKVDNKNNAEQKTDNSKETTESRGKRNSFVMYNNKMIWVTSTSEMCVGKIVTKKSSPIKSETCSSMSSKKPTTIENSQKQKKFSLLNEMGKQYKQQIIYRPGPLCKKPTLQIGGQDSWVTEKKVLPKIFMEVVPKIGEPISSNVLSRLPQNDGRLTESWVEFALSILKTNKPSDKHKMFKFPLAYSNNQKYILVRKQKTHPQFFSSKKTHIEQKTEDIVTDVINDLIKYVEIKEIAPSLIKEEEKMDYEDNIVTLNDVKTKMPAISENVSSIFKKPQKKRSKIELELSRLSCKVVNVEVEESFTEELCNKSYCRLGCLCKSLKCDRHLIHHCQKVECMLHCTCPKEKQVVYNKLTLPAGTDILSTDAVNRIEDEAKKDLAKVEREFTQTVIHTNDKTIVVGLGGRNKTRRATKAPKKYSDFIESFDPPKVEQKIKEVDHNDFFRNCVVSVERLNLPEIIPFCLIHSSYDCDCEGISSARSLVSVVATNKVAASSTIPIKEKSEVLEKKKQHVVSGTHKKKSPKPAKRKHLESKSNDDYEEAFESDSCNSSTDKDSIAEPSLTKARPIRNIKKTKHEDFSYSDEVTFYNYPDCARVRGIPSYIRSRKTTVYSAKSKSMLLKDDFINNITEANMLKASLANNQQLLESDLLKNQLVVEAQRNLLRSLNTDDSNSDKNTHKRKQTLEVRNDENNVKQNFNQDLAIQRRKKIGLLTKNTNIQPVFDGEIIIDKRNMELLKKMGPRTVAEGYARLLPWKALIESFKKGSIKIWCMVDQPSRLLINKHNQLPPKHYVDIRQTNQTSEVVLWILKNQLPSSYDEDNVSFILKQTKYNYEICGLCTKNFTDSTTSVNKTVTDSVEPQQTDQNLVPFKHKDLNGEQQMLYIQKSSFKLQELIEENLANVGETSVDRSKLYMWAALPEIYRACKWRMLFLNSDFTYLYFTKLKYSIKYTDLVTVNNMAKVDNLTVALKNPLIQSTYHRPEFGIYFDSHYQDRLFIGPYIKQFDGDDIQTLRYINKSLVCTESFNKMQGKTDYKCGHWLIERPYTSKRRTELEPTESTIDLTSDDDSNVVDRKWKNECDINDIFKKPKFAAKQFGKEDAVILHNNVKIKVIDSMPKKPEDFNRYIITNIPHFGYLGAYQHCISKELDVSWPFENKLLRFPTVSSATEFLQERFSSLLQPIPETFKINVIVLTFMDVKNSHPINASILTGHYICGEFGCCSVKTITNEFCMEKLKMKREELLKIFAKRAQAFVRAKIEELAGLLYIPKSQMGCYDIVNILDMARKEILEQRDMEKQNVSVKNDLLLQKRELALKVFNMISVLPEEQRHAENLKFREIFSNRTVLQVKTPILEPIEIPDSSDEEESKADDDKVMPTLCDQSVPEPPRSSHLGMPTLCEQSLPSLSRSSLPDRNPKELNSTLEQPECTLAQSEVPLVSILKDKSIPNKVAETTIFPRQRQLRLKSILKSKLPHSSLLPGANPLGTTSKEPISASSKPDGRSLLKNMPPPQFLPGVKIVKTSAGKLLLVSDKSPKNQFSSKAVGTKVIIKNNKILSIKSLDTNNHCTPPISVLEQGSIRSLSSLYNENINEKINVITDENESNSSNRDGAVNCFGFTEGSSVTSKSLSDSLSNENGDIDKNAVGKLLPENVLNPKGSLPTNSAVDSKQKNRNKNCHTALETKEVIKQKNDVTELNPDDKTSKVNSESDNKVVNETCPNNVSHGDNNGSSCKIYTECSNLVNDKPSCSNTEVNAHNVTTEIWKFDHSNESHIQKDVTEKISNRNTSDEAIENKGNPTIGNGPNIVQIQHSESDSTPLDETDPKSISSHEDDGGSSYKENKECSSLANDKTGYNNTEINTHNVTTEMGTNEGNIPKNIAEKIYNRDTSDEDFETKEYRTVDVNPSIDQTKNLKSGSTLMNETYPIGVSSLEDDNESSCKIKEEYTSVVNKETGPTNTKINVHNVTANIENCNYNNDSCILEMIAEKNYTIDKNIESKENPTICIGQTKNSESDSPTLDETNPNGNSLLHDETSPTNTGINVHNVSTEIEKLNQNENNIPESIPRKKINDEHTEEEDTKSKENPTISIEQTNNSRKVIGDDDSSIINGSRENITEQNESAVGFGDDENETAIKSIVTEDDSTHTEKSFMPYNNEVEKVNSDNVRTKDSSKSSGSSFEMSDEKNNCPENKIIAIREKSCESSLQTNKTEYISKGNEESLTETNLNNDEGSNLHIENEHLATDVNKTHDTMVDDSSATEIIQTVSSNDSSIPDNMNNMKNIESEDSVNETNFSDKNCVVYNENDNPMQDQTSSNKSNEIDVDTEASKSNNLSNENNIPESIVASSGINEASNDDCEMRSGSGPCGAIQGTGDCITMDRITCNSSNGSPIQGNPVIDSNIGDKTEDSHRPWSDQTNLGVNSTDTNKKSTADFSTDDSSSSGDMNVCPREKENECDSSSDNVSKENKNPVGCSEQTESIRQFIAR